MVRKKGTKQIVQEMNASISRREASRIAQNNRRKYQRRLARAIEEETGQKVSWKEAESKFKELGSNTTPEMQVIASRIEQGKAKKGGGYNIDVLKEKEAISSYTMLKYGQETLSYKGNTDQERQNTLFQNQINQSTKKDGLSLLEGTKTKGFYAATQDMWKDATSSSEYNKKIMEETGINDLETVYKLLTDEELNFEEFGFEDEDSFEAWLYDLDSNFHLFERRRIVLDELRKMKDTNDESMSSDTEQQGETSPIEINRILTRISEMLNSYE